MQISSIALFTALELVGSSMAVATIKRRDLAADIEAAKTGPIKTAPEDTIANTCHVNVLNAHGNNHGLHVVAPLCGTGNTGTLQFAETDTINCVVNFDVGISGCPISSPLKIKAGADGTATDKTKGVTMSGCAEGAALTIQVGEDVCCSGTPDRLLVSC